MHCTGTPTLCCWQISMVVKEVCVWRSGTSGGFEHVLVTPLLEGWRSFHWILVPQTAAVVCCPNFRSNFAARVSTISHICLQFAHTNAQGYQQNQPPNHHPFGKYRHPFPPFQWTAAISCHVANGSGVSSIIMFRVTKTYILNILNYASMENCINIQFFIRAVIINQMPKKYKRMKLKIHKA